MVVHAGLWTWLRDLTALLVCVAAALLAAGLTVRTGMYGLAFVAVVLLVFAGGLGFNLWSRPLAFVFDRSWITVKRLSGCRQYPSDRLDELVVRSGGSFPGLILKLSDGQQLVIRQDQVSGTVDELKRRIEQRIRARSTISPWPRSQDRRLPPSAFGNGSTRPFSAYLEQKSAVPVSSLAEVGAWLKGCELISDLEHFGTDDVWQHPVDFEQTRKGDCEDHALWAWRKLVELGLEAELVVGFADGLQHAWVILEREGELLILETADKQGEVVRPAAMLVERYRPLYGVNRHLMSYRYLQEPAVSRRRADAPVSGESAAKVPPQP